MRRIKRYNESSEYIDGICGEYYIKNYTINGDGSIDVNGDVNLDRWGLKKLPIKFRNVLGGFYCRNNELTTFDGCPSNVGGDFYCNENPIYYLWELFRDYSHIHLFNIYDIIRDDGKSVVLYRLNAFLTDIGKEKIDRMYLYKTIY